MDGNKDAARQCFNIGKSALKAFDKPKALKFFAKAQRLDPSLQLGPILLSLKEDLKTSTSQHCQDYTNIHQSESVIAKGRGYSTPNKVASADQVEIVQRICKTKDYYEILSLKRDCTAEEIRKAYKKISLKVHPDKNCAPGAEEAFKLVSKAFACLNNESARLNYNQSGLENRHRSAHQCDAWTDFGNRSFPSDDRFDADDIFNSFFFGSESAFHRAQNVRKYRRASGPQQRTTYGKPASAGGLLTLLQIFLICALFLISLLPFSKPIYSMDQAAPYEFQFSTKDHQVPFYVKSMDFDRDYPPGSFSRKRLEMKVERNMIEILGYNCRRELNLQRWNPSLPSPNCDKLQGFHFR